ncbi:MAG: hypothetical protein ABI042_09570 [Verrucomicrobiota bacterium]
MRPIKDYSKARIAWATAGVTVIVQTLAIGTRALLKIDRSSWCSPLITGLITALVLITVVNYYSKQGRDKELLPRAKSRTRD